MKIQLNHNGRNWIADLALPLDISIPLRAGMHNPTAWYCGPVIIKAVENEYFTGDVNRGGSVNFRDIFFNPHGHGTHTECVGHISKENYTINEGLKTFHCLCQVISVTPADENGDQIITTGSLRDKWDTTHTADAIAIRTLPNRAGKLTRNYSNTNPPYIEASAAEFLINLGIKHLLIDLPSVDREMDEGKLAMHHRFWNYPEKPRTDATITEFIYIPDEVEDGLYLLNLQIAPFENDASPSKPVLYRLSEM